MPELRVLLERPNPRDEAALEWVAEWLGLRLVVRGTASDAPIVHRASHPPAGARGIVIPERPDDRLWIDLLEGRLAPTEVPARMPFDIVSAIAAHLDDVENQDRRRRDRHDRLPYPASFTAERGFGQVPVVNLYLSAFGALVERELGLRGVPRWPNGKQAAVALSHDVDRPVKWGALRGFAGGQLPRVRYLPLYAGRVLWTARQRLKAGPGDDFWLFDPLVEAEADRGFRSTFLFAATPAFTSRGTPDDVYYDIAWPPFAPVFEMLSDRGFEIGLHAGYEAYRSLERLEAERDRLSSFVGHPIRGLRHHFWHLGPDDAATLRLHEMAGFAWDSSLAFNDHPGFRRGAALPFHPWDPRMGRAITTLQMPTMCMDAALFGDRAAKTTAASGEAWRTEHAVATVSQLIDTVIGVGGFGAIDWHVRTSLPLNREFRPWGKTYLAILDRLAADDRIWVTGLDAAWEWIGERRRRIAEEP